MNSCLKNGDLASSLSNFSLSIEIQTVPKLRHASYSPPGAYGRYQLACSAGEVGTDKEALYLFDLLEAGVDEDRAWHLVLL
jgi:hypothetical protein